jgi:hypothetical protein
MGDCIRLSQFATEADHEDVRELEKAVFGEGHRRAARPAEGSEPAGDAGKATLQAILTEISAEAVATTVGLPIDAARAAYTVDCVTLESHEEFNDTVAAFYLHLLRHTRSVTAGADPRAAGPDAHALLERSFADLGNMEAALAEARSGTRGGLRFVLDAMTDQFRREEEEKHVSRVFKEALDPLDWDARVGLIRALLERLAPHLPPEIREAPPERFARHHELIVRSLVKSLDTVRQILRRL